MGRYGKRKISSQKNIKAATAQRWINRHQRLTDQQQICSSEHSSSQIVENVLQHYPPLQQSQSHSSTFEAKPNLSHIESQLNSRSASTACLFEDSSENSTPEIVENVLQHFSPLQQSEEHFSTFNPNLSHIEPQLISPQYSLNSELLSRESSSDLSSSASEIVENAPQQSYTYSSNSKPNLSYIEKLNSPPYSARPVFPFEGSSERLSSSSSDVVRKTVQQSNTRSSTSKPNLSHIEPQPSSSTHSTNSALLGQGNDESNFESITAKCANCNWTFEEEIERNVKFNLLNGTNNEIQIIDAIFSIYGLTVADWSQTLTSDEEDGSVFAYVSELVFEKGISFCSSCSLALQNVYTSHQTLKRFSHNESLFTKALNTQSSYKMQIKTESGDENEVLHRNYHKTGRQETKDEGNELEDGLYFFEPMMDEDFDLEDPLQDNLDDLRPSSFTHFLSANVTESRYDLSTTDVRPKAKGTTNHSTLKRKRRPPGKRDIKYTTEQKYLSLTHEPSEESLLWSLREIKELNQKLGTDGFLEEDLRDCFVRIEQMPPDPYGNIYSFNVSCCGTTFYRRRAFIRHKMIMHKEVESSQKLAKCGICGRSISLDNIVKHMTTILNTNEKHIECTKCDMQFKHRCGLQKHMKTHDPNHVSWWCDICETHLISEYHSIVHKILKHSKSAEAAKVFPCNKCDEKFVEQSNFKSHFAKCCPTDDRTCQICDRVFVTQSVFYKHCRVKHNELIIAKYACELCKIKFKFPTSLQKHKEKNICGRPNRVVCEKCGKDFRNNNYLKLHMQQHEDIENPNKESFKCPICEKTLKHRKSLQVHITREHPKEPTKLLYCEKCGKTTKNWSNMKIHMKVHAND